VGIVAHQGLIKLPSEQYSGDLNTEHVWFSDHGTLSGSGMVWILNGIRNPNGKRMGHPKSEWKNGKPPFLWFENQTRTCSVLGRIQYSGIRLSDMHCTRQIETAMLNRVLTSEGVTLESYLKKIKTTNSVKNFKILICLILYLIVETN
jgi:hypothetical protein